MHPDDENWSTDNRVYMEYILWLEKQREHDDFFKKPKKLRNNERKIWANTYKNMSDSNKIKFLNKEIKQYKELIEVLI